MIGCYLQTVDLVLQYVDGSQRVVVIIRDVSQDGQRLSVLADSLLDGGVDARKTLDGGIGQSSAAINLLIEPCGGRQGVTFGPVLSVVVEKTKSVTSVRPFRVLRASSRSLVLPLMRCRAPSVSALATLTLSSSLSKSCREKPGE